MSVETAHHLMGRAVAGAALAASAPILAAAAVAVKVSSPGPVLYRARRVGRHGTEFTMLKFRTMYEDRSQGGGRITGGRDPRIFPVGRLLRRLKIDELPQLVNVVRGEMAWVGPRPEDPTIVAERYNEFMLETLEVLPGVTSPGTLQYFADEESGVPADPVAAERYYADVLLPKKIALDLVYVRSRSWRYDLELIVRTIASLVGLGKLFARREAWERAEAEALLAAPSSGVIGSGVVVAR